MSAPDDTLSLAHPDSLPDPLKPPQVAKLLGVSVATVYAACRQYLATRGTEEEAGLPCYMLGGVPDKNTATKGGRFIISKGAFLAWHTPATQGDVSGLFVPRDAAVELVRAYRAAEVDERAAAARKAEALERLFELLTIN